VINIFNNSKVNNLVSGQFDTTIRTSRTNAPASSGLAPFNPFKPMMRLQPFSLDGLRPYSGKRRVLPIPRVARSAYRGAALSALRQRTFKTVETSDSV